MNKQIRTWATTVTAIALSFAAIQTAIAEPLAIESISATDVLASEAGQKATIRLQLSSNTSGSAVSYFHKTEPFQVVVDISDANVGPNFAPRELVDNIALFTDIQVTVNNYEDGIITQVIFSLSEQAEYQVQVSGNIIAINFQTSSDSSDAMADLLGGSSEGSTSQSSTPKIEIELSDETTANSAIQDPLADALSEGSGGSTSNDSNDPIANAISSTNETSTASSSTDPLADALANTSNTDPLANALSESSDNNYIPPMRLSGPNALPEGIAITSLDFDQQKDSSQVVIGLQNVTEYTDNKPRPDTITIDVDDAFVPKSLSRVLDTSKFYSPVKMIRAYRTSKGGRVVITLKEESEYTIERTDNGFLIVRFPIPDYMKQEQIASAQSASSVSPGQPDEGAENAYSGELLIGESGNTIDPQSVFGKGAGANDPAAAVGLAGGFSIDSTNATSSQYAGQKINLDFVNADIHSIFRLISHVSKLNIVTGDDVSGKISVRMMDVPWDQALAAILQAKGLGSQRFGNIIRVAPLETIKSEQQSALEAKNAKEQLADLQMLIIPLNYATVQELEPKIGALLSSRGTLQTDERLNQLIIKDTAQRIAQIRELVNRMDKQTQQVLIEARIVEATAEYEHQLGIQWGANLEASTATGYSTGMFFPNSIRANGFLGDGVLGDNLMVDLGAPGAVSGFDLSLGSIPGLVNLDARLSAMEADGIGKVVSEPRVTTLDNKTAKISQGKKVPYQSMQQGQIQTQFYDALLSLNVTPHITSNKKVYMQLQITNNRADFANQVQGTPSIIIKEAQTEVLVADGDTTVIGGVFSSERADSKTMVPYLHKIPIVGLAFQNKQELLTRDELIVFITPHIVTRSVPTK